MTGCDRMQQAEFVVYCIVLNHCNNSFIHFCLYVYVLVKWRSSKEKEDYKFIRNKMSSTGRWEFIYPKDLVPVKGL